MASNKKRLYVALYPSGTVGSEERRYHWAFLIGPRVESGTAAAGTRYHVKNFPGSSWVYEELAARDVRWTNNLLARIVVAKIKDEGRLNDIIRNTPLAQGDDNWRCRSWVADVLARLERDGQAVGTAKLDWGEIEAKARAYVADKNAAGRYSTTEELMKPKPMWDLLEGREIVP
ncbi:hypothetical protein TOPH_07988 [Tolypocladium ophioglossoides CBS 100239]|uniref:Uncharacterized protein n=1 Tax=Tolypocladium ophioglossoides (strain CBS 100239) TaxID=1163406 RepID=A0A0L0MZY0_TOLOC|nr:hypothetical protein TOPH_07988 [Tolypocladium ophioglossoides CBS 100239]